MGRLALLVLLALFTFFLGTSCVHMLLASVFGVLGPLLRLTTGLTQIVAAGLLLVLFYWLFRWMSRHRKSLFTILQEPIARVESGHITFPLDRSWFALLRTAGNITLFLVKFSIKYCDSLIKIYSFFLNGKNLISAFSL